MRKQIVCLAVMVAAVITLVTPAGAWQLDVFQVTDPIQDNWTICPNPWIHELGNNFPPDERITSWQVTWENHIPCPVDYQGGGAVQVAMQNLTALSYDKVWYVADTPETSLSNWDEWVGQVGFAPGEAFKIDATGVNTPLVYESMIADGVWQPNEVWEFVIQEVPATRGSGHQLLLRALVLGAGA